MNNSFNFIFFILGILIGILLSHYSCNTNSCNTNNNTITNTSDTTLFNTIDTTYFTYVDTIQYIDSSSIISTTPSSIDTNGNIYTTIESFKDSTSKGYLEGNIKINTYGYSLKDWKLDWKYNNTFLDSNTITTITIKDSIIINNNTTIIENKRKLYAGIELDIRPVNHVYMGIDYLDKKGNMFGISVGTALNEKEMIYKIGYKRLINFK